MPERKSTRELMEDIDSVYDPGEDISIFNMPPGGPFSLSLREIQEWEQRWL